jgi:glycerophosphoryl diester phosphodiesterase
MCGARLRWSDIDACDARALDAGWGFVAPDGTRPFAGQGIGVPLFDEVLEAFPTMRLNVDLKGERAVDAMLELLRRFHAEERVTLASFQTTTVVAVRRHGYAGDTGLSQGEMAALVLLPALAFRQLPFTGDAAQVPVHYGKLRFDRQAFIAKCHSVGLRVDFWTVDDPAEAARLLALGADGIMTNDPHAMRSVFAHA